jgi:hypothetical protein
MMYFLGAGEQGKVGNSYHRYDKPKKVVEKKMNKKFIDELFKTKEITKQKKQNEYSMMQSKRAF